MHESGHASGTKTPVWGWHPALPIPNVPVFVWPPRPWSLLKFYLGSGFLWSQNIIFVGLAIISWYFLTPAIERCVEFKLDWIAELYVFVLVQVVLVAGGLQLFLYRFKRQGTKRRFDLSELGRNNPKFFGGSQVWDNIFWTCVSGVSVATAFLALLMWGYANNYIPWLDWQTHPVWFALMFLIVQAFGSLNFYLIHRLLHWRPLYKIAHTVHHRNINIGPWSGLSMHPIEHLFYLSTFFVHVILISHPIHLLFHLHQKLLAAITSHSGYETILIKDRATMEVGEFFHQLHHRYFDCNYGTMVVPCDSWAGSDHDGTAEATARVRQLQRERRA